MKDYLIKLLATLDREMPKDRLQRKLEEREEYKKMCLMWGAVFFAIGLSFLSIVFFYLKMKEIKPPAVFFVQRSGDTGIAIPFKPHRLPNYSSAAIEAWAGDVVKQVYTFDFMNMEAQVGAAEKYFTEEGWDAFVTTWNASSLKDQIRKYKVSPNVVPLQNPVIISEGGAKGSYAWKVIVPVLLSFVGDAKVMPQKRLITLVIVQVPTTENPKGLGVTQFIDSQL